MPISSENLGFYNTLKADLHVNGFWGALRTILARPGSSAVFFYRVSSALYTKGHVGKVMAMVFSRLNIILNGCEIQPVASIGPGFRIVHCGGIVIGNATLGKNVTVYQNVTMGRLRHNETSPGKEIQPTLGDDVIVYAGAVILGGISIGSHARIGANAVVTKDVPENYAAISPPARNLPIQNAEN